MMQLKNVEIFNFKGIEHLAIPGDLPKHLAVLGENGAGKTSVIEALTLLLTGTVPDSPVKHGCTEADVRGCVCENDIAYKLSSKTSVRLNGKATTRKSIAKLFEESTGVSIDNIKVATSAKVLAAMNSGQLAEYLVNNGLIPAEISVSDLLTICTVSADAEALIRAEFPATEKFDMDEIANAYKRLYDERTALNSKLKSLEAASVYEGDEPIRSISAVEKELAGISAYDAEVRAYKSLFAAYENAIKNRDAVLKQIKEIESRITSLPRVTVDPNELTVLKTQEKKLCEKIEELRKLSATLMSNIEIFEKTLKNLDGTVCPISEKLVCMTDKTAAKEEITALLVANSDELSKTEDGIKDCLEKLSSVTKKIDDYNTRFNQSVQIKQLYEHRRNLQASIPVVPDKPVKPADIEDATALRVKLESERAQILKYTAAVDAKKKAEGVAKNVAIYTEALTALSPKSGIRETIIEIALVPIVEQMNTRASDLKLNFDVTLAVDNGVHIMVNPDKSSSSSEYLPLECVSSGEQAYTLFLVMDTLNSLSGLGVLFLDDLDKLDDGALNRLLKLVTRNDVADGYSHIVMAMVDHDDSVLTMNSYKDFTVIKMK